MSLAINISEVTEVLLADGWHDVADTSFDVDDYDFSEDKVILPIRERGPVPYAGFQFKTNSGELIAGPLTSVLAVKHRR